MENTFYRVIVNGELQILPQSLIESLCTMGTGDLVMDYPRGILYGGFRVGASPEALGDTARKVMHALMYKPGAPIYRHTVYVQDAMQRLLSPEAFRTAMRRLNQKLETMGFWPRTIRNGPPRPRERSPGRYLDVEEQYVDVFLILGVWCDP